jgi:hypothetical protein
MLEAVTTSLYSLPVSLGVNGTNAKLTYYYVDTIMWISKDMPTSRISFPHLPPRFTGPLEKVTLPSRIYMLP